MKKLIPKFQKGQSWIKWEDIKQQNDKINQLSDYDKIVASHYKPKEIQQQYKDYQVVQNDNLSSLSRKFGTDLETVMKLNNIQNANSIQIGQKLKFPVQQQSNSQNYKVQKGENLSIISKKLGVDVQDLIRQNNLKDPNVLQIGQELKATPKQKNYVIIDKKKGMMQVFKDGENKPYRTYEVGVGEKAGDAQTTTKIINGKTDWDSSNFNTGAGVYTISNANPKNKQYYNVPSFNMLNDRGIEVAMAIHAAPSSRWGKISDGIFTNNKVSTGCINGNCNDMQDMYNIGLGKGDLVYVLPEDEGNYFELIDGKPVFRAATRPEYDNYVDKRGVTQKGQGVNRSINTLNYKPLQATVRLDKQNKINLDYAKALTENKQKIMQVAQIPSDIYNEIAKVAFGVLGTETNFGEEHTALGNFARAIRKYISPSDSSSPDYKSKFYTYGATEETNSVGPTQLRFSFLNEDEKNALKKLGITKNEQLMDTNTAAIATATILGIRYNQQLDDVQKKDIMRNLPGKWNTRLNYGDRVRNAAEYLTLKQQMKQGGKLIPKHQIGQKIKNINDHPITQTLKIFDPSGVSSYPDVYYSGKEMINNPSWSNAGSLAFNTLGALPVIGKVTVPLKLTKKLSQVVKSTNNIGNVAAKIEKAPLKLVSKTFEGQRGFPDIQIKAAADGILRTNDILGNQVTKGLNKVINKGPRGFSTNTLTKQDKVNSAIDLLNTGNLTSDVISMIQSYKK
jgi:LysM repeat protein